MPVERENTLVVIPTRNGSKRFPGGNKALVDLWGMPLILRTWKRATAADVGDVVVVADNFEALQVISKAGGLAMLVDDPVCCGSDRAFLTVKRFNAVTNRYKHVINVQGDLAYFDPRVLQGVARNIGDIPPHQRDSLGGRVMSVAVYPVRDEREWHDKNCTKVLVDQNGYAVTFFRGNPQKRDNCFAHVGMYGFTTESLEAFFNTPRSADEIDEGLEQLRGLDAGFHYPVYISPSPTAKVDTVDDVVRLHNTYPGGLPA